MNTSLYAKVRESARYCRDPIIRYRINVFLRALKEDDILKVCEIFGISRTTYYRWWKKFERSDFKPTSLSHQSRRPKVCPHQISAAIVKKIKYYRKEYRYGPKRIGFYLKTNHQMTVSHSTIARVIQREGLILKKYRTQKVNPHKKRYELPWPGQMMQLDIKYVPYRIQGKRLYAFNAIDDCSRWRFSRIYEDKSLNSCIDFVNDLIRYAPFEIKIIQTDNDTVFTNRFNAKTDYHPTNHEFTITLNEHGIKHRLIPPGVKELNGKVERSHRIDDDEFYWKAPRWGVMPLRQAYTQWIWEYNNDRPHSSLNGLTPQERMVEKTLVKLCTLALCYGVDPEKSWAYKEPVSFKKLGIIDTYLKYLQYLESDYLSVSDVVDYHKFPTIKSLLSL